jgi:NADPH-dependent glutamate synthase beta subunit-like oxidoreductase
LVPCRNACPAGVDIPQFVRHIAQGDHARAIAVVRERLPFSFAPSYVCFHPCEEVCRRGSVNSPIAICQLKRFAADHDTGEWRARQKQLPPTGKSVAVIGSGPAGLTAAYYLAKQGHTVTIHEALSAPGGMLRVGIPAYRYPEELLERDIGEIRSVGVEIRTNSPIANTATFEKLVSDHDAVFVAAGAHEAKKIDVPGNGLAGVHWGTEFLKNCALGLFRPGEFNGKHVAVVGGGNVAVDAARIVRRLGAIDVQVVSLENEEELPAYEREVEEASAEGIGFLVRWGPKEIRGDAGRVRGLTLKRCTRVFDERGRFNPAYDENETKNLSADMVILAIGQNPSSQPFESCGLRPDRTIGTHADTLRTSLPTVYAGGDVASGPKSVIEAIAMGRKAACEIDKALGGDGDIDETLTDDESPAARFGKVENFASMERAIMPTVPPAERRSSFTPIERGFGRESAVREAARCLACDLRLRIEAITLPPRKESALEFAAAAIAGAPETEGVYQLLDGDRQVLAIKGVMNLRAALMEALEGNQKARFFVYEEDAMYTRRESELIQQYLQEHGALPGGGADELDDLF